VIPHANAMRSAFCAELPTAPTRHEAAAPDLPRFDLCVMNIRQHLVQVAHPLAPIEAAILLGCPIPLIAPSLKVGLDSFRRTKGERGCPLRW
jgi:hypothetical protein